MNFPVRKPYTLAPGNPDARFDHKKLRRIRNYNMTNETRTAKAIVAPPGEAGYGDFTDIQVAINFVQADGGGTVLMRNGTYLLSTDITVPDDITLQCESEGAVI